MSAVGVEIRNDCGNPPPDAPSKTHLESRPRDLRFPEAECPPRLSHGDLQDPARFHRRLNEWLMKQR